MTDQTHDAIFDHFIDQPLTDVEFVQEFIQLVFGELGMTVTAPLTVTCGDVTVVTNEDNFKQNLGAQIGKRIRGIQYEDQQALVLSFEDDSTISISMRTKAFDIPEAVLVLGPDEKTLSLP